MAVIMLNKGIYVCELALKITWVSGAFDLASRVKAVCASTRVH